MVRLSETGLRGFSSGPCCSDRHPHSVELLYLVIARFMGPPIMTTNSTCAALRNPAGLLLALFLIPVDLFAWTNGELLIWMDPDRGQALKAIAAKKFENDFGLKVTIEAPREDYRQFPNCCANGEGPRHCHLGHDKVGEWADAGLIAPVEIFEEFGKHIFPEGLASCAPQ